MPADTARKNSGKKKLAAAVADRVSVLDKKRRPDTIIPLKPLEQQAVQKVFKADPEAGKLSLSEIRPDPNQVRTVKTIGEEFDGLVASIREHGVIQPITVQWMEKDKIFQVITGERRYQAAKRAKHDVIPAVIRHVDDTSKAVQQLVENIQRENLNPIEEANAFQRYMAATRQTQSQLARAVGKSQPYIAQALSLLEKLTITEQEQFANYSPANMPAKALILEALRTSDKTIRADILAGKLNRAEARQAVKRTVAKPMAGRKEHVRKSFRTSKGAATVSVTMKKPIATDDEILTALEDAVAQQKRTIAG